MKAKSYLATLLVSVFAACGHVRKPGDPPPVTGVEWTKAAAESPTVLGAIYDKEAKKLYIVTPEELRFIIQQVEDRQLEEQLKEPGPGDQK